MLKALSVDIRFCGTETGRDLSPVSNRRISSMIDAGLEIRWAGVGQKYNYCAALNVQGHRMYQIHKMVWSMVFDFAAQQEANQKREDDGKQV
jgi:hypothetical protein